MAMVWPPPRARAFKGLWSRVCSPHPFPRCPSGTAPWPNKPWAPAELQRHLCTQRPGPSLESTDGPRSPGPKSLQWLPAARGTLTHAVPSALKVLLKEEPRVPASRGVVRIKRGTGPRRPHRHLHTHLATETPLGDWALASGEWLSPGSTPFSPASPLHPKARLQELRAEGRWPRRLRLHLRKHTLGAVNG